MPGELHRGILRLVPLSDATAARGVSRQMRDEVDKVWEAWGIRATAEDRRADMRTRFRYKLGRDAIDFAPLVVDALEGSHAHHLASLGLWWLALLVAEATDINGLSWTVRHEWDVDQSALMVAVRALRPVGRGVDGKVEWAHALGDEEVARAVRVAMAMGADVNCRLPRAWPLMAYCAARGCVEGVKACLAAGAEVDAEAGFRYRRWETALVHAGRGGHEAVVEALLEAGASATVGPDGNDETLAAVCCRGNPSLAILGRLVEAGADVAGVDGGRQTAMHWAPTGEVVRWLAARGLNVRGHGEISPLCRACDGRRLDAIRALIELGADINYKSEEGWTPLHRAALCSTEPEASEMTRMLLAAGADVSAVDAEHRTPLHWVTHAACVDLLLDAGADLEARDGEGHTAIKTAATSWEDRFEVVLRLADRGADLVNTGGEPGLVLCMVEELRVTLSPDQAI